jgi:hypothetical protein
MATGERGGSGGAFRWVKGCGCALAVVALLGVLLAIVWGAGMIRPYQRAVEARELLDDRYGPQAGFTPPAAGAVPADRMEAFLSVRERLIEPCARLTESVEAMRRMEGSGGVEELPERSLIVSVIDGGLAALGLEQRRGELLLARNEALLDVEMGQGEYTYIYAVSYSAHLASWKEEDGRFVVEELKVYSRVRRVLGEMLQRQLVAVEAGPDRTAWAEELAAEIARLEEEPRRIPWMEGLPPRIEASVAPYRERLDALWFESAAHLELLRNEIDGIQFHTY